MFFQTNILVDADGRARVAGLGVASISYTVPVVDVDRFFHGAAPELVDPQRFGSTNTGATTASDVYAFGVVAWEVGRRHVNLSGYVLKRNWTRFLLDELRSPTRATLQGFIQC
jgi:hypothetical protein